MQQPPGNPAPSPTVLTGTTGAQSPFWQRLHQDAAWAELYARCYPALVAWCLRWMGDRGRAERKGRLEKAERVACDAITSLFEVVKKPDSKLSFTSERAVLAYLRTTAQNSFFMAYRPKKNRPPLVSHDALREVGQEPAARSVSPLDAMVERETEERILREHPDWSEEQRIAAELRISHFSEVPLAAAEIRICRILEISRRGRRNYRVDAIRLALEETDELRSDEVEGDRTDRTPHEDRTEGNDRG